MVEFAPFLMVVAIVAIISYTRLQRARFAAGGESAESRVADDRARLENERMREEVRALKERVAVLERIATDANSRGSELEREIEALRRLD